MTIKQKVGGRGGQIENPQKKKEKKKVFLVFGETWLSFIWLQCKTFEVVTKL